VVLACSSWPVYSRLTVLLGYRRTLAAGVIFLGVLGGAMTLGFIGIFIGPTLLAVGYRVIQEWSVAAAPIQSYSDDPAAGISETRVPSQAELKEVKSPEPPGP